MNSPDSQTLRFPRSLLLPALGLLLSSLCGAATITPTFAGSYTLTSLGTPTGVPPLFGGLTLLAGNQNTLLLGGNANVSSGGIYSIGITRDGGGHITGFSGAPTLLSTAPYIDGGLAYGPGGVLFYTGFPVNTLGQIKPGSSAPDKITTVTGLGVASSVGSLVFAPNGDMKLLSYNASTWYTAGLTPDGTGTFNVGAATLNATLSGGIEGAAYVPAGSAVFATGSVLVAEFGTGIISSYQTDANWNPIAGTRIEFITGLSGAEGAFIDPVTGDFLFSTYGGGNEVVRVSGFTPPPQPPVAGPDAGSTAGLLGLVLAALAMLRRKLGRG